MSPTSLELPRKIENLIENKKYEELKYVLKNLKVKYIIYDLTYNKPYPVEEIWYIKPIYKSRDLNIYRVLL